MPTPAPNGPLLAVALIFAALSAAADVREEFPTRYYDVEAPRSQKLHQAVTAASPIRKSGRVFHGYTEWYVRWTWRHRGDTDGRCRITSVEVSLTGSILLPRLNGGSRAQNEAFDRYLVLLAVHEEGHRRIAREAAQDIERLLRSLPEARSCRQLESEANAQARARLDEYLEREREYDRATRHGHSQGAVLGD